jgi:hypothetical protein
MKIRVTSTSNFILFLKKLKVVDRSVLLELTETDLFCKVHTPDKSVMKFSRIPTNLIFDPLTEFSALKCDRIKIGLLDITRLMDSFRYFRAEEEVFLHLEIATIDDECVATELKLISPSLKIRIKCADLSLLSYVEDSISDLVQSQEDALASFKFFVSDFSSVSSLCGMESNSEELLNFSLHSDYVRVIGESFDYKLTIGSSDIDCAKPLEASIYKSHLNYVDSESCICFFHENRIVFASDQTPTSTAIGIIEK